MKPPTKADLEKLQATLAAQTAKLAGTIVTSGHGATALPYAGISIYQTPYWLYLKENLTYAPGSSLIEAMQMACCAACYTPRSEPILIVGETGTGKETFARSFAQGGANLPFVAVNCTGLPDYLVESELFGHVAGSFTGATGNKQGLFSAAGKGVILLDEIGDLPLTLQPKLLRVIQQRTIRPVGSVTEQPIDCRIVCATHKNLEDRTLFREDLYWRISTHVVSIPPLRDRVDDIKKYLCKHEPGAAQEVFNDRGQLIRNLPGNYRELQQIINRYRLRNKLRDAGTPPA